MELRRLGASGLKVSELVLGCMSYGTPGEGNYPWSLGYDGALPFFRAAVEAGVTTFDTADMYSYGASEEITGRALAELTRREDTVIATKVFHPVREGGYGHGLSRKHIMDSIDASLRRLGTDYVDLYQIHRFDPETPVEETMQALDDVVRAGKARYIGASSMSAWQFAKLQYTADLHGFTRFVSMQDQYNLLQREEEREMHPFCQDQGVGVLPWSPLARGRLARPWGESTARSETDAAGSRMFKQAPEADRRVVEAVAEVASERGAPQAQVALAWVRQRGAVTAPIVGATKLSHLQDAVAALSVQLSQDEMSRLEEHYATRYPEGYKA